MRPVAKPLLPGGHQGPGTDLGLGTKGKVACAHLRGQNKIIQA